MSQNEDFLRKLSESQLERLERKTEEIHQLQTQLAESNEEKDALVRQIAVLNRERERKVSWSFFFQALN